MIKSTNARVRVMTKIYLTNLVNILRYRHLCQSIILIVLERYHTCTPHLHRECSSIGKYYLRVFTSSPYLGSKSRQSHSNTLSYRKYERVRYFFLPFNKMILCSVGIVAPRLKMYGSRRRQLGSERPRYKRYRVAAAYNRSKQIHN